MEAVSDLDGMSLRVTSGPKCQLSDGLVPDEAERSGTVEIRTYTTEVRIRRVVIQSRLRDVWFKGWVGARVRVEIDNLR